VVEIDENKDENVEICMEDEHENVIVKKMSLMMNNKEYEKKRKSMCGMLKCL
jgi:hypothetical protein